MFHVRKLAVRRVETPAQPSGSPPVVSAPEEFCSSSLIFLKIILSNPEFLVDSGASVSVFPGPKSLSSNGVCLLTADGSPMFCSSSCIIPLCFSCGSGSKVYTWNVAPVSVPLLGADFLEHFNLIVDINICPVHALQPLPLHSVRALHEVLGPLRCVLGVSGAAGSIFSTPSAVPFSSWTFATWGVSFSEAAVLQIQLAWPLQRCRPLDMFLSQVSTK